MHDRRPCALIRARGRPASREIEERTVQANLKRFDRLDFEAYSERK